MKMVWDYTCNSLSTSFVKFKKNVVYARNTNIISQTADSSQANKILKHKKLQNYYKNIRSEWKYMYNINYVQMHYLDNSAMQWYKILIGFTFQTAKMKWYGFENKKRRIDETLVHILFFSKRAYSNRGKTVRWEDKIARWHLKKRNVDSLLDIEIIVQEVLINDFIFK